MPRFTIEQYNSLNEAYALGATTVQYVDRTVTYRSITDMKRVLNEMEAELFPTAVKASNTRIYMTFTKGC